MLDSKHRQPDAIQCNAMQRSVMQHDATRSVTFSVLQAVGQHVDAEMVAVRCLSGGACLSAQQWNPQAMIALIRWVCVCVWFSLGPRKATITIQHRARETIQGLALYYKSQPRTIGANSRRMLCDHWHDSATVTFHNQTRRAITMRMVDLNLSSLGIGCVKCSYVDASKQQLNTYQVMLSTSCLSIVLVAGAGK